MRAEWQAVAHPCALLHARCRKFEEVGASTRVYQGVLAVLGVLLSGATAGAMGIFIYFYSDIYCCSKTDM